MLAPNASLARAGEIEDERRGVRMQRKQKHWSEELSVDQGEILLKWMLAGERSAPKETEAIAKLLSEAGVGPGRRVLDICCGYGRHSIRLAEKGYRVTGIDLSEANIRHARQFALDRKVSHNVQFAVGDIRNLQDLLPMKSGQKGGFDAIVGILPAIGYYDEEADEQVLRQLCRFAGPKGVLVLALTNRDWLMERYKFLKERVDGRPAYEMHHSHRFDYTTSRMMETWSIYQVDGQDLRHLSTIEMDRRLYSLHELIRLLGRTGWRCLKSFGNYELGPVDPSEPMIIALAEKR